MSSRGSETSGENVNNGNNAWDGMKDVPFRGDMPETESPNNGGESDDYYTFEGEEYRNIDKIDISTEQGKYEWLDALLENGVTHKESKLEDAIRDGYEDGDEVVDDLKSELSLDKRQQKILTERIDISGDGGVIGALQREYVASQKRLSEMQKNGATQNAIDMAYEHYQAASNLLNLIESEVSRRGDSDSSVNKMEEMSEMPDYLSDIDDARRREIVDTSAEMTAEIPTSVICGGNAQRILYEAYTGKKMFGVGKNDSDIYVSGDNFNQFLSEPPTGYDVRHELDENGNEKWIQPESKYMQLIKHGEVIDVFGRGDNHDSVTIELDGKQIRVQSLTDQIKDKLDLMMTTEGLTKIEKDPVHNPDPTSKYGVYAQKLLEVVDARPDEVNEDELPDDWRDTLETMAAQGKYGELVDAEKEAKFREKMEKWKETERQIKEQTARLMEELKSYYDKREKGEDAELPSIVADFDDIINESAEDAKDADGFIRVILGKMSDEQKDTIRDRIKRSVVGNSDGEQ